MKTKDQQKLKAKIEGKKLIDNVIKNKQSIELKQVINHETTANRNRATIRECISPA